AKIVPAIEDLNWCKAHGALLTLQAVTLSTPAAVLDPRVCEAATTGVAAAAQRDKPQVVETAVRSAGRLLLVVDAAAVGGGGDAAARLASVYAALVDAAVQVARPDSGHGPDARRLAVIALKNAAKSKFEAVEPQSGQLVSVLMACVRDRAIPVKLAAERALVHVLGLRLRDPAAAAARLKAVTAAAAAAADAAAARTLGDYARRVLTKIAEAESEAEEEEDGDQDAGAGSGGEDVDM
ncbi:hypothetical protein HK405_009017, partial [Cladochytrium tenue]